MARMLANGGADLPETPRAFNVLRFSWGGGAQTSGDDDKGNQGNEL